MLNENIWLLVHYCPWLCFETDETCGHDSVVCFCEVILYNSVIDYQIKPEPIALLIYAHRPSSSLVLMGMIIVQ